MAAPRVVSLVPSLTETVMAWGLTPIAVTRFCEHPELRTVGGTKDPDLSAIVALRPDVVLVNTEENRREDVDALEAADVIVHVTEVERVADVQPMLSELAARLDIPAAAVSIEVPPAAATSTLSAFVPIWRRPWMTMNGATYGSSLLEHIGVANVYSDDPVRYPSVTLEEVGRRRPDVVLAPSEPYPFGPRHEAELSEVGPVRWVDGQDLFWWGVRTGSAIERLRRHAVDPGPGHRL